MLIRHLSGRPIIKAANHVIPRSSGDRLDRLVKGRRVTVGVAAKFQWLYPDGTRGPALIAASERMITTGLESNPIEHTLPVRKGSGFGTKTYMLAAGAIQIHSHLLREFQGKYSQEQADALSVWDAAKVYSELFRSYRSKLAEQRFLAPLGLTMASFIENANKLPESKAIETWNNLENFNLDFEALFLGFDGRKTAILEVNAHGVVINHDDIGYGAIGVGGPHAAAHLMLTRFAPYRNYYDALWSAFCAKRRGEAAPGVGDETDMVLVNGGGWVHVPTYLVDEMKARYEAMRGASRERDEGIAKALGDLDAEEIKKGQSHESAQGDAEGTVRDSGESGAEDKASAAEHGTDETQGNNRQPGTPT